MSLFSCLTFYLISLFLSFHSPLHPLSLSSPFQHLTGLFRQPISLSLSQSFCYMCFFLYFSCILSFLFCLLPSFQTSTHSLPLISFPLHLSPVPSGSQPLFPCLCSYFPVSYPILSPSLPLTSYPLILSPCSPSLHLSLSLSLFC